jgi:hypothetical protein
MSLPDSQNLLSQLNDIIAPAPPSFWPLPAIFWLLTVLIITAIVGLFIIIKKYKKQLYKQKLALQKLQTLQQSNATFIQLNQLLKGASLLYFTRQDVASLHGEQWFYFLQTHANERIFEDKKTFIKRLYNNNEQICSEQDFAQAKAWIKSLNHKLKSQKKSVRKNV